MNRKRKLLTYCTRLILFFSIGCTLTQAEGITDGGGKLIPILPGIGFGDSSREKYVSRDTPLDDKGYIPSDLVSLSGSRSIDTAGRYIELRRDARESLVELSSDFEKEFGRPLVVVSGYRSARYQQRLWDLGRCSDTLCAPPGYSEHQLGLAIDIFEATTEKDILANRAFTRYVKWMRENAHLYGWTESYQNGVLIDAYEKEPWHWRYVGIPLATKLKYLDMSYTEYIRFSRTLDYLGFTGELSGYLRFIYESR